MPTDSNREPPAFLPDDGPVRWTLADNSSLRLLTLCALYVAQGIPWGFVTVTFAAWLAQPTQGLSTGQIGAILGVASLPWSFKFFWGPLMDRFTLPKFGRRRPWIVFAQGMAILVLSSLVLFDDLPGMVWVSEGSAKDSSSQSEQPGPAADGVTDSGSAAMPVTDDGTQESLTPKSLPKGIAARWLTRFVPGPLAALILLANIFVSMQDVAVDALAVDLLKPEERGVANGLMYGSSYLGTAIGGAGLGWVVAQHGIAAGVLSQAALLFLIMLLPLFLPETSSASGIPTETSASPQELPLERETSQPSLPALVKEAFFNRPAALGLVVALGVRIGIGVLTAVFVDYLLKDGGWTMEDYTRVTGGYAVLLGLVGAAGGGFLADRFGPRPMIVLTSMLLAGLWLSFGMVHWLLSSRIGVTGLLLAQEFLLAVMSASLFALFMGLCRPRFAATQFTTYMAMLNLSTTTGSYLAGTMANVLSIHGILITAAVLQAVMSLPVLLISQHHCAPIGESR
ncbi:MAG: MFS transporter [Planctomycetaceae bacterium]